MACESFGSTLTPRSVVLAYADVAKKTWIRRCGNNRVNGGVVGENICPGKDA